MGHKFIGTFFIKYDNKSSLILTFNYVTIILFFSFVTPILHMKEEKFNLAVIFSELLLLAPRFVYPIEENRILLTVFTALTLYKRQTKSCVVLNVFFMVPGSEIIVRFPLF